ncbi:hypothetical protein C1X61_04270 [Pseudomonas sp. FW215-T2]|nr:hypothetical protein C1X61_04270 [Pseudomonas sp. FW215-T2]PNA14240.1 hypothetical protein C1X62_07290 [Pseudomonas sp. FW215-R3]PNB38840.1 hypothetical protein C1X63_05290 [Pseudomonas sp. FW305-131]
MSVRTPSRASSLPHWNAVNCGNELARDGGLTGDIYQHAKTRHKDVVYRIARPLTVRLSVKFVSLCAIFAFAAHKAATR